MILNSPTISGSLTVTGNTTLSGSINVVGGLTGTSSFATTAISSSYSATATSASYALASTSASYGLNALTSSNSMTASSADTLYVRNNATVLGSITAQTLVVQTVTSSVLFSTGSNKLGSLLSNVQELTGSVGITGSLSVVTTGTEFQVNAGGVNIGNALTDSHIISGSVTINPNGLFVSSSGNVGIGTTSPSVTLDVKFNSSSTDITGSGGSSLRLLNSQALNTNNFHTGIWFRLDNGISNKNGYIKLLNNTADSAGDFAFILTQSGTEYERVRIKGNGNVGIGTSSPSQALHLSSTSAVYCRIYNSTGGGDVYLGSESGIGVLSVSNAMALDVRTNNATRIYVTSGGNVGIGTISPSYSLHVNGTAYAVGHIGGYVTASSGYVNETQTITTNGTSYYLYKYTGNANGSSSTIFNITGLNTANGTFADIYAVAQKDATGNAINTNLEVQINGQYMTGIQAGGTSANTVRNSFRVCRMESSWIIIGAIKT